MPGIADTVRARLRAPSITVADIMAAGEEIIALQDQAAELGLPVSRVAILGSLTTDLLVRALACAVVMEGVFPVIHQAPFGATAMIGEILDPASTLYRFRPDIVFLVPDWRDMVRDYALDTPPDEIEAGIDAQIEHWQGIWSRLAEAGCRIIQHTLVPPPIAGRGVAERQFAGSVERQIEALNRKLIAAGAGRVVWLEADRLARDVGLRQWSAARFFYSGRLGFDPRFLPDYVPHLRAAWRSATGRAKKLLVLDLDNTLWGGVIGDDGVAGLILGPDSGGAGEAFADFQAYLGHLRSRGVALAICSKNDPDIAASGFTHPQSRLARSDFAAFVCSWDDKAAGLKRIAAELNLGLDSIVFADDNEAEIALVIRELPEVETVLLGNDPTQFIGRLEAGHWFDQDFYTAEDAGRAGAYQARAQGLATPPTDLNGYLRDLGMTAVLRPARLEDLPRLAQLEMKTNQFNLTTRRYGLAQLEALSSRADACLLAFWLTDRFAAHGLTAFVLAIEEEGALRIDSWLMSCRIFGRSAEQAMLLGLIDQAKRRGLPSLLGEYLPTDRNGVVAELYEKLGFVAQSADGRWWKRGLEIGEGLRTTIRVSD